MMFFTPREMMKIGIQTSLLMVEAQRLLALRMMTMWRVFPLQPESKPDAPKPVSVPATARATLEHHAMPEKPPAKLRPLRRAANSNVTRLARRAPGKPA
jgi:hypothetical protein